MQEPVSPKTPTSILEAAKVIVGKSSKLADVVHKDDDDKGIVGAIEGSKLNNFDNYEPKKQGDALGDNFG